MLPAKALTNKLVDTSKLPDIHTLRQPYLFTSVDDTNPVKENIYQRK